MPYEWVAVKGDSGDLPQGGAPLADLDLEQAIGTVTQITSITTAVTLNSRRGQITTVSATLAAGVDASFTVNNNQVKAGDIVLVHTKSYGGTADGIPIASVEAIADGSFRIGLRNQGAVTLDAVVVISFVVIKTKLAMLAFRD